MEMESHEEKYLPALESFIVKMENLREQLDPSGLKDAMGEFCELIHIAKIEIKMESNPLVPNNSVQGGWGFVFYNNEEKQADEKRAFHFVRVTGEGNRMEYLVYPIQDSDVWTENELKHINSFVTLLFIFNSRAKVMDLVDRLRFRDEEFSMYNMNYFMKTVGQRLMRGGLEGYVCCRFNIRKMSIVNRQVGVQNGTEVMRRYIKGLEELVEDGGFVCRLGGDNFVGLFRVEILSQFKKYMEGTYVTLEDKGMRRVRMSATVGLYEISVNNHSPHDIMEKVSAAYEIARADSTVHIVQYDDRTKHGNEERRWVEGHFEPALKGEEFQIYYQPKVDIRDNSLDGAEALCRWIHRGVMYPPARFIPILERSGDICLLDFYNLEHVCQDIRGWMDDGIELVRVSINFSRLHLGNEELAEDIIRIVDKYQVPHEYIEIELTETTTDVDFRELKRVVNLLHEAGIHTAVDDFGVGYSSLNLLRELPWDVLKIDKSFLPVGLEEAEQSKGIMLKYVIAMAHDLGLECIVEGTETQEQIELLKKNNCYKAQGFYFNKPLPKERFKDRLLNPKYEK